MDETALPNAPRGAARTRHRLWRISPLAVALAAVALAAAACGGGSSDPSAHSGSSTSAPANSSGTSPSGSASSADAFSACMRSHGVPNFPDPNSQGQFTYSPGSGIDPSSPQFQSAEKACESIAPSAPSSGSSTNQNANAFLKYAACMRANGVPNFPDPTISNGHVQMSLPSGVDTSSPQFQQATQACMSDLPGAGQGVYGSGS
jgi:hypothetical protein